MKFVDNWSDSWRWISMQCAALVTTISATWLVVPADYKTTLANNVVSLIIALLGGAAMFGRLIQQTPQPPKSEDNVPK